MAVRKKQSKITKFIAEKGKGVIISTIIFAVVCIAALVVGFGLKYGWLEVLKWFTSSYAVIVYIFIAIFLAIVVWVYHQVKMRG